VNAHRVSSALAESLMSGVNALAAQKPVCLPAVPPATTTTTTEPVVTPAPAHGHHEKHHRKHGKHGDEGD
jgi:hypothetical protein